MTSAFGGQRSIQLSYGCLIAPWLKCRNYKLSVNGNIRSLAPQPPETAFACDQGVTRPTQGR